MLRYTSQLPHLIFWKNPQMHTWGGGIYPTPLFARSMQLCPHVASLARSGVCSLRLVSQTSAALGAAASQHLAAIAGSHALTEAVLLGTLALLGLIGTKHGGHLLIRFQAGLSGPTTASKGCGLLHFSRKKGTKNPPSGNATPIIDEWKSICQPNFSVFWEKFFRFLLDYHILYACFPLHTNYSLFLPVFQIHL